MEISCPRVIFPSVSFSVLPPAHIDRCVYFVMMLNRLFISSMHTFHNFTNSSSDNEILVNFRRRLGRSLARAPLEAEVPVAEGAAGGPDPSAVPSRTRNPFNTRPTPNTIRPPLHVMTPGGDGIGASFALITWHGIGGIRQQPLTLEFFTASIPRTPMIIFPPWQ